MDDLLSEFLTETAESLDVVDVELVKFEQEPNNAEILDNIFRLVHTVKGTCGFLGLPRLEAVAHAAETLMGKFRDGAPVTPGAVSLVLSSIDRIKVLLEELEQTGQEPDGNDQDLIGQLEALSLSFEGGDGEAAAAAQADAGTPSEPDGAAEAAPEVQSDAPAADEPGLPDQTLERELRPGEVSLDELERAFQEAPGPEFHEPKPGPAAAPAAPAAAPSGGKDGAPQRSEGGVKNQSIRVNVDTLEKLMTTVSELVLTRNQLLEIVRRHEESEFKVPLQRLSNVTAELQEGVMKTRMQPIGNAWQKLPRIVRDLAQEVGKKIELEMSGEDTELDRQVLEKIKDPLTHMVRNSADHGLESTEDRIAAGKKETGTVRLSAYHEGGHIIIEVSDDGRGINLEKVGKKAVERGLVTEAELEKMSETQIQKFIFDAGFSTAQKVTSVSGRGVGMDVVRTNIELIGGSIDLKSITGQGSTFTIKIPLTLAIVSALIVESAEQRFAIPQLNVVELVRAQTNSDHRIETIKETPVLRLRNKLLPLIQMSKIFGIEDPAHFGEDEGKAAEDGFIVVTQVGQLTFGIVVDGVFHTEEIVVKPMSTMLKDIPMFSGNTILGDGSVIMIIDPNGIAQEFGSALATTLDAIDVDAEALGKSNEATTSLLLFRAGSAEPKAVPLSLVTRLEEINVGDIETVNGRSVVQYRGTLMPLVFVTPETERRKEGTQPLLVFADASHSMGLVVDDIVDIVEDTLDIEIRSERPGMLGSAVIKGKATEILDLGHYLPLAFEDWFERKEMSAEALTKRALFVDDSPFFRNMLTPVLKAAGYKVDTMEDAQTALAMLAGGTRYDVIISDIEMPGMNGFEFAEAVTNDPRTKQLPIIALSSHSSPAAISRGRQAGFFDYVAKFDREGLIAALKEASVPMEEAA